MTEKCLSKKVETQTVMFNVKNEVKQFKGTIDLLTNQIKQSRSKQFALSKEETKLKRIIMEKNENLYNLVRTP